MRTWSQCKISSSCLCVWYNSRELIYRGSPRFPTPMVKSSSKDLLPPIKSYWVESQPAFMDSCLLQAFGLSTQQISTSQQTFVLKTSFVVRRRLDQDEYIHLAHTSSRRLDQDQYIRLGHTSSKLLQDVLQKRLQDILKTSSRHFRFHFRFEGVFKTSCKDAFKTCSRRIIELICSC